LLAASTNQHHHHILNPQNMPTSSARKPHSPVISSTALSGKPENVYLEYDSRFGDAVAAESSRE
jgi:hypothetical protein